MSKRAKFQRLAPYVARQSATFEYLSSQSEQAGRGIVLDPRQSYAAIRVRRPDGTMDWIIATEPITPDDAWGEIMFVAGIDCSSAELLIDMGAVYIREDKSVVPNVDGCATSFGSGLPGSSGNVGDASGRT
ncbi:hypothetical protein [Mycobacteroides abscessus]|uniref:hypothetical protein n=1 Tax=Mycobacteroides abscessus TaxID=36809 RepID=UPI0021053C8B|nr:hypothetical protein [Mycobacteroides abscessus]